MKDAIDDVDKVGSGSISQVGGNIKLVVNGKIIEVLTRAVISNAEDMMATWRPEG